MKTEFAYLALVVDGVADQAKARAFTAAEAVLSAGGVTVGELAKLAQRRKPDDAGAARVRAVYDRAASAALDVLRGAGVAQAVIDQAVFQVRITTGHVQSRRRSKTP